MAYVSITERVAKATAEYVAAIDVTRIDSMGAKMRMEAICTAYGVGAIGYPEMSRAFKLVADAVAADYAAEPYTSTDHVPVLVLGPEGPEGWQYADGGTGISHVESHGESWSVKVLDIL